MRNLGTHDELDRGDPDGSRSESPALELLYFDGCPNHTAFLPYLRALLADAGIDVDVQLVPVTTDEAAQQLRFLGSPSLRVDGVDVEPAAADRDDYGLQCRLYRNPAGLAGTPPDDMVLAAVRRSAGAR